MELLVFHRADINKRARDGRTPHTLAALHGNEEVAAWLLRHGAKDELSPMDRFVAACASGNQAQANWLLKEHANLRSDLRPEHQLMMHTPAEHGDAHTLETMLQCGFNPNVKDSNGVEALHRASMGGHPEAVRVLLANGASVNAVDGMFAATPLVWAWEGWRRTSQSGADHVGVARLLLTRARRANGCRLRKHGIPREHRTAWTICAGPRIYIYFFFFFFFSFPYRIMEGSLAIHSESGGSDMGSTSQIGTFWTAR